MSKGYLSGLGTLLTELKPYTYKVHSEGLFWTDWVILFEGGPVRVVESMSAKDVEQLVWLLNCSYQNGYGSGAVWGFNQKEEV